MGMQSKRDSASLFWNFEHVHNTKQRLQGQARVALSQVQT